MSEMRDYTIYLLSDSLGETAQYVARAAANQFPDVSFHYKPIPFVEDIDYLAQVLDKIDTEKSILMYTLVVKELSDFIRDYCMQRKIPFVDVLALPFQAIESMTGEQPKGQPGLVQRMDESYFKKIESVEFAIKYDDGKDPTGLKLADLVLIGVSRTSKTPLSMYLAYRGLKVANLPLVPQVKVSEKLFEVPKNKIVGLTIRPDVLGNIRRERLLSLGVVGGSDYTDMARIFEEIDHAEKIMKRIGCPIIDVSHKAVEETANVILQIYYSRGDNIIE
ncbi:MAG: pyruvate, water dikinase regulatory protein [Clostridia bacterium]|nr:pyruvate, water dikinase regulatory protein [Clostridiales bacterium]MDU2292899.1 pyruvate, water dikinase regulatory protein [Peptococcus niger]MDU7505787.1 pyruvate, water dikinase regulatory protein [Clostridia bacterium]